MDKRWMIGCCALFMVAALGCRSAQYRVQRYYRYPPPYAQTGSVSKVAATPTSMSPTTSPARTASGQKTGSVPTHAAMSATSAPPSVKAPKTEPKEKRRSFWRFLGGSEKKTVEPVTSSNSPPSVVPSPAVGAPSKTAEAKTDVSSTVGVYRLKIGDPVVVYLRGIPGVPGGEQQIENIVGEDGSIQLPYVNNINVLNMTATEAQDAIRRAYLDQQIYKHLTVNVVIPARSYYIRGEVRQPGRYPLMGTVTVLQAIAAAGGYTEFASYGVDIVRGERRISLNMRHIEKRPELDQNIEPGDIIIVNRSFF